MTPGKKKGDMRKPDLRRTASGLGLASLLPEMPNSSCPCGVAGQWFMGLFYAIVTPQQAAARSAAGHDRPQMQPGRLGGHEVICHSHGDDLHGVQMLAQLRHVVLGLRLYV
jgi:hypothetical protein